MSSDDPAYVEKLNNLTNSWHEKDAALTRAKGEEAEARKLLFDFLFAGKEEGTHYVSLGHGWRVKATVRKNYKLDPDKAEAAQEAIAKEGNEGTFIADRLVKWKPELSVGEYKKLEPKYAAHIADALTITDGMPSIELVPPPAK